MIEKGSILTGSDADVLSSALSEVKTIVYKKAGACTMERDFAAMDFQQRSFWSINKGFSKVIDSCHNTHIIALWFIRCD